MMLRRKPSLAVNIASMLEQSFTIIHCIYSLGGKRDPENLIQITSPAISRLLGGLTRVISCHHTPLLSTPTPPVRPRYHIPPPSSSTFTCGISCSSLAYEVEQRAETYLASPHSSSLLSIHSPHTTLGRLPRAATHHIVSSPGPPRRDTQLKIVTSSVHQSFPKRSASSIVRRVQFLSDLPPPCRTQTLLPPPLPSSRSFPCGPGAWRVHVPMAGLASFAAAR